MSLTSKYATLSGQIQDDFAVNHYLGRLCYFGEVKNDVYTVWAVLRGSQIIRYTFPINQLSKFSKVSLKKLTDEEKVMDFHVVLKPGGHYVFE